MTKEANSSGTRGDRTGVLIASICFVHCVAGPVLLSLAGFASLTGISEKLEPLFLVGSRAMGDCQRLSPVIEGIMGADRASSCFARASYA